MFNAAVKRLRVCLFVGFPSIHGIIDVLFEKKAMTTGWMVYFFSRSFSVSPPSPGLCTVRPGTRCARQLKRYEAHTEKTIVGSCLLPRPPSSLPSISSRDLSFRCLPLSVSAFTTTWGS